MGRQCTSFMGRSDKRKEEKKRDVSAQKARRPSGKLPCLPNGQSAPASQPLEQQSVVPLVSLYAFMHPNEIVIVLEMTAKL